MQLEAETDHQYEHRKEADEERLAEVTYHTKMNRLVALFGAPVFAFFAILHFRLGNTFQALIYALLFFNAIAAVIISHKIKDQHKLILLKRSSGGVAFGLLAVSVIAGTLSENIYIFLPWLFTLPVAISLFFGKRIGIYSAMVFTLVAVIVSFIMDLPPWDDSAIRMFKLNTILSLFTIMTISLIGEKIRTRVQNDLVASQEEYRAAEERQREANVELQHEIELRTESEKLLRQSEMRYRALFEESAVSLWEEDWSQLKVHLDQLPRTATDDLSAYLEANSNRIEAFGDMMRVTAINRSTLALFGADTAATLLNNLSRVMPPPSNLNYLRDRIINIHRKGRFQTEIQVKRLDGAPLHLLISSTVPAGFQTAWEKVFTSVYDVTERVAMEEEKKRVEEQLNEARQMQAIATMAGGIAHQFNNALASIYGNVELIEMGSPSPKEQRYIDSLRKSAERMSMLTDQLLAYARGGKYQPKAFLVNDLIEALLASDRIEPKPSIAVSLELEPNIYTASGDTTQIEMVIEVVISNALESMDTEGQLTISTRNLQIAGESEHPAELPSGSYALIQVMDNGAGMDEQTCARIFEPFFTTKFFGRGLGMAAAYGIVQNHNGMITVDSTPEKGTCVTIYLPREMDNGSRSSSPTSSPIPSRP